MSLFDCAISEKCCSIDGGRGSCPLFSSPTREIWQLKCPHPWEFAIQGKKNANARGSARGGGGLGAGGIDWGIIASITKCENVSLGIFNGCKEKSLSSISFPVEAGHIKKYEQVHSNNPRQETLKQQEHTDSTTDRSHAICYYLRLTPLFIKFLRF